MMIGVFVFGLAALIFLSTVNWKISVGIYVFSIIFINIVLFLLNKYNTAHRLIIKLMDFEEIIFNNNYDFNQETKNLLNFYKEKGALPESKYCKTHRSKLSQSAYKIEKILKENSVF
jgi:hypothetical protein